MRQLPEMLEDAPNWMQIISSVAKQISDGCGVNRVVNQLTYKDI